MKDSRGIERLYIPEDAGVYDPHGGAVVVYTYETVNRLTGKVTFCAIGYRGKARKPTFHISFSNRDRCTQYVTDWLNSELERIRARARKATERKAYKHGLQVGDILYATWGYDQTNVDFYEVVALVPGGKSVKLVPIRHQINGTGFMCGEATPVPGSHVGDVITRRVAPGDVVKVGKLLHLSKWHGRPVYVSWYS